VYLPVENPLNDMVQDDDGQIFPVSTPELTNQSKSKVAEAMIHMDTR
jgi:hypothetical protein